eukprot:TRINITY_DN2849_c0_g2_i7.p1 TRINITY_DN2849_c0_g2~~TRINITY_DN2849_c0_g2_i7.p1  ORF type:complete len:309 (-),score=93.11 TRINITY_DN2849_c0_g2_i7:314-1240(-)
MSSFFTTGMGGGGGGGATLNVHNSMAQENIISMITFIKNGVIVQPLRLETEVSPMFTPTVAVRQMTATDHVVIQANFGQTMFFYQHIDKEGHLAGELGLGLGVTAETANGVSVVNGGKGPVGGQGPGSNVFQSPATVSKKEAKKIQKELEESFSAQPESATTVSFRQNDVEVISPGGSKEKKHHSAHRQEDVKKEKKSRKQTKSLALSKESLQLSDSGSSSSPEESIEVIVYFKKIDDENILGEITVDAEDTIAQFKDKITKELDVESGDFKLFKGKGSTMIPISIKQYNKLAAAVFKDTNTAVILPN